MMRDALLGVCNLNEFDSPCPVIVSHVLKKHAGLLFCFVLFVWGATKSTGDSWGRREEA